MSDATPISQPPRMQPFSVWNPTRGVWETSQADLYGHMAPYSETWPTCGTTHDGLAYLLPMSVRHIPGSESSSSRDVLFRTPLASDSARGGETLAQARARRGTIALSHQVSWQDSGSTTSPGTACGTPERPGWPTPASPCTSSKRSSDISRSRPPRATCTPTTGTSPKPPDRPTSSSPQPPQEGTPPAATDPACDRLQNPTPTLPEGAGASSCADSGPLHGHLLVHFTRNDADPDWSTSAADGSSRSSQWTSQ